MAALVGNLATVGNHFDWTLLFARQPEPDLEFTEEELDQTTSTRATGPLNPRKKSGGSRPLIWLLLLILVGGIAYVATMEPEMLAEWLSPYLGENTPAPVAMKPKPLAPAPVAPAAPEPQATPGPSDMAPAATPPATSVPTAIAPAVPAVTPSPAATKPASPAAPPAPMFGEGQKVTVTADATAPVGTIPLYADSTANKPGPLVRTGVTLTVLDGDFQSSGWMYLVRTDEGAKGWVSEKRLRLKF